MTKEEALAYNIKELENTLWKGFTLLEDEIHNNISDDERILDDNARCIHSIVLGHIAQGLAFATAIQKLLGIGNMVKPNKYYKNDGWNFYCPECGKAVRHKTPTCPQCNVKFDWKGV